MNKNFQGIWPALITPATATGDVNIAVLRELVEYLLSKAVDGLYLCGSTGEGLLLSTEERRAVTEAAMAQIQGRIPVIVHVGSVSTREAVSLAKHACEQGAAGVSAVLPVVRDSLDSTYRHYETIARAAPDLPFFPYLFGGQTDAVTLMRELKRRIPNLGGAKYTGPNMYEMERIIDLSDGGWTIFSGMDEQCLFGMMSGAPGNIGSTLNFMPGAYREMRKRYGAGDVAGALALQQQANQVTTVLIDHGFSGALRELMRLIGFDCGEPRLPHLPLAADKRDAFRDELDRVDFRQLVAL